MKDDIDAVLQIAKRFGVKVFLTPAFARGEMHFVVPGDLRGLPVGDPPSKATSGPLGHWCLPVKRSVWFQDLDSSNIETHLHEVCHVIMNPPGGIDQLSEDVVLMPFERILAKQCLSPKGYAKVLEWQENGTQIEWWDAKKEKYYQALEEVPNYTRWWHWRQSHAALRAMGCVKHGRATWKWPDWRRAPKETIERGNLI